MAETVDRTLQRGLVIVYSFAVAAGLASVSYTPPSMAEVIGGTGANTWGVLTLLGGIVCLIGVLVPRGTRGDWFGEYVGIWALVAVVLVYAGVVVMTLDHQPGRLAGVFVMGMLAALLVVRWFRVRDDARSATSPRPSSPV